MSDILDRGSLLFAAVAVLAVSLLLRTPAALSFSFYTPLLILSAAYVPGVLLLCRLLARAGDFQRDYVPLLTCIAMAWAAANLPLAVAERLLPESAFAFAAGLAYLYFLVLVFFAVRTVFGAGNGAAAAVVCLSWLPLIAAAYLWLQFRFLLRWIASPFVLFYLYYYFRNEAGNLGAGLRSRQNFRRMLDAAAVNPHDAEAQYQLGLVYQERRQLSEAIRRFEAAVAIDPKETGSHFQLGRIALQQGRLKDALGHFQIVLDQDEKHHQHEILRELGALYIAAGQFGDAGHELAAYIERRPYDPEGLYYYGQALEELGKAAEANEMYRRATEAVRAAPRYMRRSTAKWSRLSQRQLRRARE